MEIHVDFKRPGHTYVNSDKQKLATPVKKYNLNGQTLHPKSIVS